MTDKKMNKRDESCCNVPASGASICKECGNNGKSIKEITLKSILKESKLENIKNFEGFYFCETQTCKVVYFNNEQEVYLDKGDVKVRVGIKETEDPIPVCYCFGWTQEKIFNQIKQLGHSTAVQEITAKVKAGECACERNNPSGRCCLGEVNKVVKRGMELYGKNKRVEQDRLKNLPIIGAIISAIVASICCIGPVILAVLSVGGAGLFSKFGSFRPYFIGITAILLGWAFYLTYRKREVICEDGTCKIKGASKWNKIALWGATILIALLLAFPYLKLSSQECDIALSAGFQLVLTVRANSRGKATSPPENLDAYQRILGRVLDKYRPAVLVVENEENSSLFYTGTPEEYTAELKSACQVAHQKGIPCTNGGLVSTLVALLVYEHYLQSGQAESARNFADRVFTPEGRRQLNSSKAREQIRKGKALLASYRSAGADYVNFHWYIADTRALEEAVAYLKAQTGLPVITNEIGQHTDDPNQTTAVMEKVVELGLPIVVWFSVDALKARALVNKNGTLRPTGQAFKRFIQSAFS